MLDDSSIDDMLAFFSQVPQLSDNFFIVNRGGMDMLMINFSSDEMWFYMSSYGEAADFLVKKLIEIGPNDLFTVPIIYLYRHQIEILLKLLIRDGSRLAGQPFNSKLGFPKGHNLNALWKDYQKYLTIIHQKHPGAKLFEKNIVKAVTKLLKEFSDIDPHNVASRYHVDENNKPSFLGWTHIDILHYSNVVHKLTNYLRGSADIIADL